MSSLFRTLAIAALPGVSALAHGPAAAQVGATGHIASAQDAAVDRFSRNRGVSVAHRARPAYEARGIRSGAFRVYPRIELSAERNDNIYATGANEVVDTLLRVRPEIAIESGWSQNLVTAYARGSATRYAQNDGESTGEYGLGAAARIDVTRRSNLHFGFDHASTFEPRTAPSAPRKAVALGGLNVTQAHVSASRAAGYVKLSGRADWRVLDYDDVRTGLGAVIDQDARDRRVASLSARVDIAISPDTAFFIQAAGNDRRYEAASAPAAPNRDSRGSEYLLGANFEISAAVRGEIAAGYIEQSFDKAAFDDVSGFGVRAQLEWFPTGLTTVAVAAGRTVEDTPVVGAAAYLSDSASLAIDHELRRNVILSAKLTWNRDDYEGAERVDRRSGVNVGAIYLVNRNLGVNVSVSTLQTRSAGAARDHDFNVNRLAVSLVAQF